MGLVGDGHEHRRGHGSTDLHQALTDDAGQEPGQADGDAHTGEGALAVGGQGVVAAPGAH